MKHSALATLPLLLMTWVVMAAQPPVIDHQIGLEIVPADARLVVADRIRLPRPLQRVGFRLHADLEVSVDGAGRLGVQGRDAAAVPTTYYELQFEKPTQEFTLRYQGRINHPIESRSNGYRGGRGSTPGIISSEGVFLSASSAWYPLFDDWPLLRFRLDVTLPEGWQSVSQGEALEAARGWQETQPQDEIYLIAGRYSDYRQQSGEHLAQVFLRSPDPSLAARYLDVTGHYLGLYSKLLGAYPYAKFALVENFWETGYGMPSFTLLGPRVIRLPFILHSSYPHEILHNWWGNGVFVDYSGGNWSEGLTSYLADHLIKEQQGQGAGYRRRTLQSYADYVSASRDFPLREFRGNHGQASQAVGYGRTLMMLHMLRRKLGDQRFVDGLRRFYRDHRFQLAGFDQLRESFQTLTEDDLTPYFAQWTNRTGAPKLELGSTEILQSDDGYQLRLMVKQTQAEAPFSLVIPLFVQLQGDPVPVETPLAMDQRETIFTLRFARRPLQISLDPRYELFRQLDPSEVPGTLGKLFGAEQATLVLPAAAAQPFQEAYQGLARSWAVQQPGLSIRWDKELDSLPVDQPVWIVGADNRFADSFDRLTNKPDYQTHDQSIALVQPHPHNPAISLGLISADSVQAIPGLARKLPHYGRYSFVTFQGSEPVNRLKGEWPARNSKLSRQLQPGEQRSEMLLPKLRPLTAVD